MAQVDNTVFFSIILTLVQSFTICYGILFVYLFYPFISKLKLFYNFLNKIKQVKELLICFF